MKWMLALLITALAWTTPACSDDTAMLWDVNTGTEVALQNAAENFPRGGIVFVGEQHDEEAHHQAQLEVIRAAHEAGLDLAVGLEMIQHRDQEYLDRWIVKDIGTMELSETFARNWGHNFKLYQPIFEYCRGQGIPMVGLNVPRGITRKVARNGFESLNEEERGQLPPITCEVGPEYENFLRRVVGAHGHGGGGTFERFCEAQLVWDTAMAVYALEYLDNHPDKTMVVLLGMVHAWKPATPRQVQRRSPETPGVVIQPLEEGRWDRSTTRPVDADYLFLR